MKNRHRPSSLAVLGDKHVRGAGAVLSFFLFFLFFCISAPQCRKSNGPQTRLSTSDNDGFMEKNSPQRDAGLESEPARRDVGETQALKRTEAELGSRPPQVQVWFQVSVADRKSRCEQGRGKQKSACVWFLLASLTKSATVRSTLFDFNLGGNVWKCGERLQGPREEPLPKPFSLWTLVAFWEWWFYLFDVNLSAAFIHRSVLCLNFASLSPHYLLDYL